MTGCSDTRSSKAKKGRVGGWVNFFGDPNTGPYLRSEEMAQWFGVSVSTMQSKSKTLREGMQIVPLGPDSTHSSLLNDTPLAWMVELTNGMITDIRHTPREAQEAAFEHGLIPYIPDDRSGTKGSYQVVHTRAERTTNAQQNRVAPAVLTRSDLVQAEKGA